MSNSVLVIGGGIAGVQASLDLADAGCKVILVEKTPSIGGIMAALDKNFPTLDCSICIEAPKLSDAGNHPNIEILSNAEVIELNGNVGNFKVKIKQKSKFVTSSCTRCGDCTLACPIIIPNEFDVAMASRKAIYTPFPQSVPGAYTIDMERCLNRNSLPSFLNCDRCLSACGIKAINFDMPFEQILEREVASIIVATGYDMIDPTLLKEYGYGAHPDILTSIEFERLLTSAGPTGGEILKPSDMRHPHHLVFILCVGSRDRRYQKYCSRFCCMYSLKEAIQAKDHGVDNVSILYMDLRSYGKKFDEFYHRAKNSGINFIRGKPSKIFPKDGKLCIQLENTIRKNIEHLFADMVVLAIGVTPSKGLNHLAKVLGIELDENDGFIKGTKNNLGAISTTKEGIYVCGCASGPKDIPDSVAEGSAAAASALTHIKERTWPKKEGGIPIDVSGQEPRVGVFVCDCGSNIAGAVNVPEVVKYASTLPNVVFAEENKYSCAANTLEEIAKKIIDNKLNRVVVAACSPKTHEGTFRGALFKAGLNPYLLEMANIRNHDSWVHKNEPELATEKAKDLVWMAVEKAKLLTPLETLKQPVIQTALVIGGGIAGIKAATNLAKQGYETHLVEKEKELGGLLRYLDELSPTGVKAKEILDAAINELKTTNVKIHLGAQVENIGGVIGSFSATLSTGEEIRAGAIILAMGADIYTPSEFNYGKDERVITNFDLESQNLYSKFTGKKITFISCIGSRNDKRGCSRYCCSSMIYQAIKLRKAGNIVRILYRDIRTYSRHAEEMYEEAMRIGVQFFKYPDEPAEKVISYEDGRIRFFDQLLNEEIEISTDVVILVCGFAPKPSNVMQQLKISMDAEGFIFEKHPKLGPVEATSPGIYIAGTVQGPKDVQETITQALAASGKASILLAKDTIEKEPITADIDWEKCKGCGLCAKVCPFNAIELVEIEKDGKKQKKAKVAKGACMGCGTCVAGCNFDAITQPGFTDEQIISQIDAALAKNPEEKVIVFACNWCSYAGADQAGIEKLSYPPSSRIIRMMCSGRVSKKFVTRAFEKGAAAVMITGCHPPGDCHYIRGNIEAEKRFNQWKKQLIEQGIEEERFQLHWNSASEGKEFAAKMHEMHNVVVKYSKKKK
jgi:heterodisulfide reductase subunit A